MKTGYSPIDFDIFVSDAIFGINKIAKFWKEFEKKTAKKSYHSSFFHINIY